MKYIKLFEERGITKLIEPIRNKLIVTKKVVVFCDEGEDDWNNYFKREFDSHDIEFTNIQVFESAIAMEETYDIFMFDWGGMSLGNSMLNHFIRRLMHIAEDNPQKDFVLLSTFTDNAYRDELEGDREGMELDNIYTIDEYVKKLKSHEIS